MVQVRAEAAKASNQPITAYSPIAHSLLVMNEMVKGRMKRKFDIHYVMAKETLSLSASGASVEPAFIDSDTESDT